MIRENPHGCIRTTLSLSYLSRTIISDVPLSLLYNIPPDRFSTGGKRSSPILCCHRSLPADRARPPAFAGADRQGDVTKPHTRRGCVKCLELTPNPANHPGVNN